MIRLRFESRLAAPAQEVRRFALTMLGVNAELMPLVRMSYPAKAQGLDLQQAPVGELVFHSWLLLFGLLPVDRHALAFDAIRDDGFDERSSSWLQQVWIHRRRIEAIDGGTRVQDELEFQPRLRLAAPLSAMLITQVFRHRHRRLCARYGALSD
ncbi:MAG TPA: hypothetical protein VLI06_09365 [Solimonas sp.]|nr:hypothetical protein [Solimonas sp.]